MEPVNITICGTPSAQTLADLLTIAMRDGLGFVLPPRLAAPAVAVEPPTERRRLPDRADRHQADKVCERCGKSFQRKEGASGRFCSRACYEAPRADADVPPLRAKHVKPQTTPAPSPAVGRASLPDAQAARERRDAVVGQLRRAGESGLSFRALLTACRTVLAAAGDDDQQVSALRNALTILQRDGKVKRFAGQWIAASESKDEQ